MPEAMCLGLRKVETVQIPPTFTDGSVFSFPKNLAPLDPLSSICLPKLRLLPLDNFFLPTVQLSLTLKYPKKGIDAITKCH